MSELDDIEYTDPAPDIIPATDESTDLPDIQETDGQPVGQDTKQALSTSPPCTDTTRAPKIENRPLLEQGKKAAKGKKGNSGPETIGNKPTLPPLSIKQSMFVHYLTDPSSPTYGNQTRSWIKAYGNQSYMAAGASASIAVKSPRIHGWIEEILKRHGADTEARVAEQVAIAYNRAGMRKVKRQVVTKAGEVVDLVDEYEPTFNERLHAHDMLNKLSGDYARAQVIGSNAQAELDDLLSDTFTQDKARLDRIDRAKDVTGTGDATETTGEGD